MTWQWRNSQWSAQVAGALLMALVVVASGVVAARAWAAEFSQAELFFELNDTDGDLGIHASIDGGPYVRLEIEDPQGRTILVVTAQGRLAKQGLTQLFFESAEPPFDELPAAAVLPPVPRGGVRDRGHHERRGRDRGDGAAQPRAGSPGVRHSGRRAAGGGELRRGQPTVGFSGRARPHRLGPGDTSHPTIGKSGPVEIVRYQFFVEQGAFKLGLDLPPDVTEFQVPSAVARTGRRVKFEIIARTATGNNTAVENCFVVAGP